MTKILEFEVFNVFSVDPDPSFLHIVKTGDQIDQCGFATSALSDQCNGLALFDPQIDGVKYPAFTVGKADPFEFD